MSTTTTNNDATTWRDLADQLTPEQIAKLERLDTLELSSPQPRGTKFHKLGQLVNAAGYVKANARRAEMPIPGGAVLVHDWFDTQTMNPGRAFCGSTWVIELTHWDMRLRVDGVQHDHGTVERQVSLNDHTLTVDQARQLADALTKAAAEVEQMAGFDKIEVTK